MRIMRAPQAPVIGREQYGQVEYGFMRNCLGEIFFLAPHGSETIRYPVLEDGTISPRGEPGALFPGTVVELVHPRNIGITEIRWAE